MTPLAAFTLVYLAAAGVAALAAAVMWQRRQAPGAVSLALMLAGATLWALCDAVELHMPTAAGKQLLSQIQYVGVVPSSPLFLHAAVALAGRRSRLPVPHLAAIWVVPVLSLALAWTNDSHHWLWTEIVLPAGDLPFAVYRYGWWFWVLMAQHYVLMVAATWILLRSMRVISRGFRTGMALVLLAVVLPWIGNALYNLKLGPWPGLNYLTLSLGASGWLLVWVVTREGLLDLLPRAQHALTEMMDDAVVVVDRWGEVIFSNRAARDRLHLDRDLLVAAIGAEELRAVGGERTVEAQVNVGAGTRWLDLRLGPVFDRWGRPAGRLIVARDITAQKAIDAERERLIADLKEALGKVSQLEGLLPICASCRKVRDDQGYWERIDAYLGRHSAVTFTHGICPDCELRLYPELSEGGPERWKI